MACNHVFINAGCYSCNQGVRDRQYKKMHKEREQNYLAISDAANRRSADYERRHRERMAMYQQQQNPPPEPATIAGIPVSWILKVGGAVALLFTGAIVLVVFIAYQVVKALIPLALIAGAGAGIYYGYRWLKKNQPEVGPVLGEGQTFVGIPQAPPAAYPPPAPETRVDISHHYLAPGPHGTPRT